MMGNSPFLLGEWRCLDGNMMRYLGLAWTFVRISYSITCVLHDEMDYPQCRHRLFSVHTWYHGIVTVKEATFARPVQRLWSQDSADGQAQGGRDRE